MTRRARTPIALGPVLLLALAGCEKGSGSTNPDEATPAGEDGDAPEDAFPDDEDAESGDEPY